MSNEKRGSGIATIGPITTTSGAGGSGGAIIRRPLDTLTADDLRTLREIIAQVIDEDGPSNQGGRCERHHHEWDFSIGGDRIDFISAVIARIIATAAPAVSGEGEQ